MYMFSHTTNIPGANILEAIIGIPFNDRYVLRSVVKLKVQFSDRICHHHNEQT